jgi:anion-transporting  ArsA/GET3 family ATPase
MSELFDRRLIVVVGKGGVGRTTVAAALGLAAVRAGKRTILAEVAEQERLAALFGVAPLGHAEGQLAEGLCGLSIDPERALSEWLRHQLHSGALAAALGHSRIFSLLTAAAPGVSELMTIGKVWDMAQLERRTGGSVFDVAIVDAPATGHGLAMLRAPSTYAAIARVGPVARQAGIIADSLSDPAQTAVVAVALPEELPINETIDLEARLDAELGRGLDAIVVNAVEPQRFSAADAERLTAVDGRGSAAARTAVAASLSERRRAAAQHAQVRRLRRAATAPVRTLPHLSEPELGLDELERISRELERRL